MMKRLTALFVFALLVRVLFLDATPFYRDEALYAEIIDEMIRGGSLIPHYAGLVAPWKPPLTFWVYSAFVWAFGPISPLPFEVLYRLPSVLLGAICAVLVYLIVRKVEGEDLAIISSLIYSGTALSVFVNRMLLTDSLLSFFVLASFLCYLKASEGFRWVLLGGLFAGLAVFTKSFAGLFAILLVVAYYLFYGKKFLRTRNFMISLAFILLAFTLIFLLVPGADSQYAVDSTQRIFGRDLGYTFGLNLIVFLGLTLPWLALALYGAYKYRRELEHEKFWLLWLILGSGPLFTNGPLFWYFLPLIPAISVFSGKVVLAGGRADASSIIFVISLTLLSIGILYVAHAAFVSDEKLDSQRSLGNYLSGKDSLFIGTYSPTAAYYKFRADGDYSLFDTLYLLNTSRLDASEAKGLIVNSTLPKGSIGIINGILHPYQPGRMHMGGFNKPKEYIALGKEAYREYEPLGVFTGFGKSYEDENFIVLRRGNS